MVTGNGKGEPLLKKWTQTKAEPSNEIVERG